MPMRKGALAAFVVLAVSLAGCMRREGRNSDCKWPGEAQPRSLGPRHLSADAEFAEDLAIRYADTHYGLRTPGYVSGDVYDSARNGCMALLFEQVAKEHSVTVGAVSASLGRNRVFTDLSVNLPFMTIYCLSCVAVARRLWRKYPPAEDGWVPGVVMVFFLSLVMAIGGMLAGEVWAWIAETYRVGNGHMSYRVERLWWGRHRALVFASSAAALWVAASVIARPLAAHAD